VFNLKNPEERQRAGRCGGRYRISLSAICTIFFVIVSTGNLRAATTPITPTSPEGINITNAAQLLDDFGAHQAAQEIRAKLAAGGYSYGNIDGNAETDFAMSNPRSSTAISTGFVHFASGAQSQANRFDFKLRLACLLFHENVHANQGYFNYRKNSFEPPAWMATINMEATWVSFAVQGVPTNLWPGNDPTAGGRSLTPQETLALIKEMKSYIAEFRAGEGHDPYYGLDPNGTDVTNLNAWETYLNSVEPTYQAIVNAIGAPSTAGTNSPASGGGGTTGTANGTNQPGTPAGPSTNPANQPTQANNNPGGTTTPAPQTPPSTDGKTPPDTNQPAPGGGTPQTPSNPQPPAPTNSGGVNLAPGAPGAPGGATGTTPAPVAAGPREIGSTTNNGVTTTVFRNPDGTLTTVSKDAQGNTVANPAPPVPPTITAPPAAVGPKEIGSTTNNGVTTTVFRNPDGTLTTVSKDAQGNTVANPAPPIPPTVTAPAVSNCPPGQVCVSTNQTAAANVGASGVTPQAPNSAGGTTTSAPQTNPVIGGGTAQPPTSGSASTLNPATYPPELGNGGNSAVGAGTPPPPANGATTPGGASSSGGAAQASPGANNVTPGGSAGQATTQDVTNAANNGGFALPPGTFNTPNHGAAGGATPQPGSTQTGQIAPANPAGNNAGVGALGGNPVIGTPPPSDAGPSRSATNRLHYDDRQFPPPQEPCPACDSMYPGLKAAFYQVNTNMIRTRAEEDAARQHFDDLYTAYINCVKACSSTATPHLAIGGGNNVIGAGGVGALNFNPFTNSFLLNATNTALNGIVVPVIQNVTVSLPAMNAPPSNPNPGADMRVAPRDPNARSTSARYRSEGWMQLASFHPRDPLLALSPRGLLGWLGAPEPQAGGAGQLIYSLVANGNSSGEALELQVFDPSGAVKNPDVPEGMVLEPLKQGSAKPVSEIERGANILKKPLVAYCVEYAKLPPEVGMLYRLAPQAVQDKFSGIRQVLQAGRELAAAGKFHPDSDADAYNDSIRQYALWTKIGNWDQQKFGEVFLEKTQENAVAAKVKWTKQMAQALNGLIPGRWRDISMVLDEAGRLSKAPSAQSGP
jgi:hypothetical protein